MEHSKFGLESPENWFSGALHAQNVDLYDSNITSPLKTQYEVQISFRHEVSVVKPII